MVNINLIPSEILSERRKKEYRKILRLIFILIFLFGVLICFAYGWKRYLMVKRIADVSDKIQFLQETNIRLKEKNEKIFNNIRMLGLIPELVSKRKNHSNVFTLLEKSMLSQARLIEIVFDGDEYNFFIETPDLMTASKQVKLFQTVDAFEKFEVETFSFSKDQTVPYRESNSMVPGIINLRIKAVLKDEYLHMVHRETP